MYKRMLLANKALTALVCMGLLTISFLNSANASNETVEFNTDVIDVKERNKISLDQFSKAGYVMPGNYSLIVRVNNSELQEQSVNFYSPQNDNNASYACITSEIADTLGLKENIKESLHWWHNAECMSYQDLPGTAVQTDLGTGILQINIPQAYLDYIADNWDPPSLWDEGIPGVLFDYNFNAQSTKSTDQGDSQYISGNGTVGGNYGPWRLRADWQSQYSHDTGKYYSKTIHDESVTRYYAYRAVKSLNSRLLIGEDYLNSAMFDSFRFAGMSLVSDDTMLPPNLRGYAPEIRGVAKSNATVTVRQKGRILYQTQVAAGPFSIQDLNDAVSGVLDVTVREQDGSEQDFQINTANIPYLTRPGSVRFKFTSGKPSNDEHHLQGPGFITSEFSWGVNNGWSLYGGALLAGQYNSLSSGVGRDLLSFGAVSFDITTSRAKKNDGELQQGRSYRVSYSKRFDEFDSQVTFAGYRFSEREFMNMSQYLESRFGNVVSTRGKEMYTVSMNKQFRDLNTSVYLNYNHQTYWDSPDSDNWNLTASHYFDIFDFRNVSFNFTGYRTVFQSTHDVGVYLGLTIPLDSGASLDYAGGIKNSDQSLAYSSNIDENNNYRISSGRSSSGQSKGDVYFSHAGDIADLTTSASYQGNESKSIAVSMQGGGVATMNGAALHRSGRNGGTRMLIDTDGVRGVPVQGNNGVIYTNYFGKAVVTDVTSYYRNSFNIDLDRLPDDIEANRSVVQGTLTDGAIGYRRFAVIAGLKAMASIRLEDGTYPPFGAIVENKNELQTGLVNDDGSVWLSGIRAGEVMSVKWNGVKQCEISLPDPLPKFGGNALLLPCEENKNSAYQPSNQRH